MPPGHMLNVYSNKLPLTDRLRAARILSVAEGPDQVSNMSHHIVKGAYVYLGNEHGRNSSSNNNNKIRI